MRTALVQLDSALLAVPPNLERALQLMEPLAADLFVLPELFPSGYTFAAADEVARVAEPAADGPSLRALGEFARRRQAWVAYGFAEAAGGKFYNSANVVGPGGLIVTYRKLHLFGREKLYFTPGDAPAPVVDVGGARAGLMICFDWYFPEVCRGLALAGAELILHPSNLVLPHCPQAMITRALENHVWALTCDRVGTERHGGIEHRFIGCSQVVSPGGEIRVRLSGDREETAVVAIDPAAARDKRVGQANDVMADRRPELYA